jgi:restriction endonuclease S subunit
LDYPALLSLPIIEDKRILQITSEVITLKKQNEKEANELLATIDDYILKALGITLPNQTENNLQNRMYSTSLKSITNKRFDSFFHQKKFTNNLNAIANGKYKVMPLREIMNGNLIKGSLPKHDEKEGDNLVVQINSINPDGTIELDDLLTSKNIFSSDQKLNKGDILVVITGATIGKIAYWQYDGDFYLGGDIVKFQSNSFFDSSFVYHFLRSSVIQTEIKRNITGATNGHLAPEDVKQLPIPVPPMVKQKEIADHITTIRQQAQKLKNKTRVTLAQAGKEIESILLS